VSKMTRIVAVATTLAALAGQGTWAAADGSAPSSATIQAAGTSSDASEQLQEVTVTAHRVELEKRVSEFINQIAAAENEEGLPRWKAPVCPLVSGLTKEEGDFIVGRISQIARDAGAPLAGKNCHPKNLYILVHPQPKELLQAMAKRNRAFTVGNDDTPPEVFDSLLAAPRAVRVWYTTEERTLNGVVFVRRPGDPPPIMRTTGSTLDNGVVWQLAHVFVVVDQTRLRGITRGQLADYAAMVALADLKPGANLGDAPSILTLFDGSPEAAPNGISDWDLAFLKSLYTTDQKSKQQRNEIAHQMVSELKP
jgi:hypothetical protein